MCWSRTSGRASWSGWGSATRISRRTNPALVYAAIRGFGDPRSGESPYANWPSYDVVAQAMGGLMSMTGTDRDHPMKTGPGIGDVFAGMMLAFAIVAAVRHAEKTGQGQFVDIAMYDAMLSLCERLVYLYDMEGKVAEPAGNGHPLLAPFGLFPASDGWVSIGVVDDAFWRELARIMERPDLLADQRLATKAGPPRPCAGGERRGQRLDAPAQQGGAWRAARRQAALRPGERRDATSSHDPHVAARGMIAEVPHADAGRKGWRVAANPIRFSATPALSPSTPPRLGEHNHLLALLARANPAT